MDLVVCALLCPVHYVSFSAHADYSETSEFVDALRPPHVVSLSFLLTAVLAIACSACICLRLKVCGWFVVPPVFSLGVCAWCVPLFESALGVSVSLVGVCEFVDALRPPHVVSYRCFCCCLLASPWLD